MDFWPSILRNSDNDSRSLTALKIIGCALVLPNFNFGLSSAKDVEF